MSVPLPSNEYERLIELTELDLDYSNLQEHLEDLTTLAAKIAGTEISLINLIDSFTQWSVANWGLDIQQMAREDSVCQYSILEEKSLEIQDLQKDDRFSDKFYVKDAPHLRYYYGVPLETSNGMNIGALCVLDTKPKEICPENQELLKLVANQVIRRLEALKRIRILQDKLKESNLAKYKVSHDIRGPLAGIIGIAEIMKDEIKSERISEVLELADLIQKGGESLLELADSIMLEDDKKSGPGENEYSCKTFSAKLNELYSPQAKAKGVHLDLQFAEHSETLYFSKNRLTQIVGNLLSNSIKFTPKEGTVKVIIEVDESRSTKALKIEVEDSGTGMSEDKILEILSGDAGSQKGTSGEIGYGFGLSLVQHLVAKAKGSIDVVSAEGEGTRFSVTLPV